MRIKSKILLILTCSISLWQVEGCDNNNYLSYDNSDHSWGIPILPYDRVRELERLGKEIRQVVSTSHNETRYQCDSYYDYICGGHTLFNSVLGSMPRIEDLAILLSALNYHKLSFSAKSKLIDYFHSCTRVKSVDDCYIESFESFRPLYGFIIVNTFLTKNDTNGTLNDVLNLFINKARQEGHFANHPNLNMLENLAKNITNATMFFTTKKLDAVYMNLTIYPNSYSYNVKNLENYNRLYRNFSDYETYWKSVLDFTIYLYQSRNKPRSYYYPTLNVHLWMTLFNNTVRYHDGMTYNNLADCFKLPSHVNVLEEARNLAVVYYKSFKYAWDEYTEWFNYGFSKLYCANTQDVYDSEDSVLRRYGLSNKHLFFMFYAQNFCFFGKEMAENIFYQGLKHNIDFVNIYQCSIGHTMNPTEKC